MSIPGLIHTANVYTGDRFQALALSGLRCRLAHVNVRPAPGAQERAELLARRRLMWPAGVTISEYSQVEVEGQRWNVIAGTFAARPGPSGAVMFQSCDVERT